MRPSAANRKAHRKRVSERGEATQEGQPGTGRASEPRRNRLARVALHAVELKSHAARAEHGAAADRPKRRALRHPRRDALAQALKERGIA